MPGRFQPLFPVGHFFYIQNPTNRHAHASATPVRNELHKNPNRYIIKLMNAKDYTVTVPEYASRWKLNIQTVRRFIREGRLHAVKVGRCYFLNPDVIPDKEGHSSDK